MKREFIEEVTQKISDINDKFTAIGIILNDLDDGTDDVEIIDVIDNTLNELQTSIEEITQLIATLEEILP